MRNGELIQFSSPRYYQGRGVLEKLGQEAWLLGRRALIVADDTVWEKANKFLLPPLKEKGITWFRYPFSGICAESNYARAAQAGRGEGCDLVIGCGGGRALDTAKIASDLMEVRCITVPSSAATCAATAWLSVHYREDGSMIGNYWVKFSPFATFSDLRLLVDQCPMRFHIAGMIDAMAKFPEIVYNIGKGNVYVRNAFSDTAAVVARHLFDELLSLGPRMLKRPSEEEWERMLALNLQITGLTLALACGGKQAAVSHQLYAYVCDRYPAVARHRLHGEIVGASLLYQLRLDGEEEAARALKSFLISAGAPLCMTDLGLPAGQESLQDMLNYLMEKLPVESDGEEKALRRHAGLLIASE
ncbi:MAG: iron-containing alcohol dehydrogenase [Clostridia bacterium]|nr:iron-containing alcohol dehydrogenase [Clostridia bacterium]